MTKLAAPTADRCAACGAAFHCGAADAEPCPCGGITLSAVQLAALRLQYKGCLCLACLRAHQATDSADNKCDTPSRSA